MLDRRTYLVKERVAFLRLIDTYDILDPASGAAIGVAQERISVGLKTFGCSSASVSSPCRS